MLINSEGNSQTAFNVTNGLSSIVSENDNMLKGTLEDMSLNLSTEGNYYSLGVRGRETGVAPAAVEWVVGFYQSGEIITLNANRAYLDTTIPPLNGAPLRGFDLSFGGDDTPTSIAEFASHFISTTCILNGRKVIT